jgi:hypothetical protein
MRGRHSLLIIPAGALLAVLPIAIRGTSCGHDFEFHLLNWLEVGSQWRQGVVLPHWEFTAAWNSGEPRFIFYPPLSWAIGALLGLILPWVAVPATFIWVSLLGCGFTMYRLAREWTNEANALVAACFYMVHPYMLFTTFERSAYAELLAAAWMPLLVLSILRPRLTIPGIALPVTLLWLTDNPAAVMGCYSLALLATVRIAWMWGAQKSSVHALKDAATVTIGTCLGLGLSGFFLLPAIVERRWVRITMAFFPGTRYQDNFLFGRSGSISHIAILKTASFCSVTLLISSAVFAWIVFPGNKGKTENRGRQFRSFVIIALLILASALGFLLTAASALLWRVIPELKYLQFPWRFGAVLGVVTAALFALALDRRRLRSSAAIAAALAIPLIFGLIGYHLFHQFCGATNGVPGMAAAFKDGTTHDATDEYTPASSDPLAIGHNNPTAWMADAPTDPPFQVGAGTHSANLRDRLHFSIVSPGRAFFVIDLRDYPAWRITVNGMLSTNRPHREDGLIVLPVSGGRSEINITYARSSDEVCGWILTVLSLGGLCLVWRENRPSSPGPNPSRPTS